MAPPDAARGGRPSQKSIDTSEKSSSNQPEELLHATNGASGASRINGTDSRIAINKKHSRVESSSDVQDGPQPNKKSIHRLETRQSTILESFFSVCAHPDENQRRQLSQTTGLDENQVKFWFQNKRTHVKNVTKKEDNLRLRLENEILRDENNRLKQAKRTVLCPSCTNDPRQLQMSAELERLKVQNECLQQELARLNAEFPMSSPSLSRPLQIEPSSENVFVMQYDVQTLAEIAKNALHEFAILADSNGPLWLSVHGDSLETLNERAYAQTFGKSCISMGLKTEATRADAMMMIETKSVVQFLMNAETYGTAFPGLIAGAKTTKVYNLSVDRNDDYDGVMQLMTIELVFPSPLVPGRKCTFLRYCKKLEQGAVAIIDVSLDDIEGTFSKCRKMPSGILIQTVRNYTSKVTVIEHVQVDDTGTHELLQPCLTGLLFGARRWVMSMARQCARLRDVLFVTSSSQKVGIEGRKALMKLADNLLINYAGSIAGIPEDAWAVQCGVGTEEDIKIMYRNNNNGSNTATVCASACFLVPVSMRRAFDLLKNNVLRVKWDILVNGGSVKEEVRVANGNGTDDSVSILHVKHGSGARKETSLILQNSSYDVSGSFIVYSSLDKQVMDMILSSGNNELMSNIPLLPTGFSFVPVPVPHTVQADSVIGGEAGGTLVTIGFQILMKLARGTGLCPRSVSSVIKIMSDQIESLKDTLTNSHPVFYKRIPTTI